MGAFLKASSLALRLLLLAVLVLPLGAAGAPAVPAGSAFTTTLAPDANEHVMNDVVVRKPVAPAPAPVRLRVAERRPPQLSQPAARPWRLDRSQLMLTVKQLPDDGGAVTSWGLVEMPGHYGATVLATGKVLISPSVPRTLLLDVMRHEWAHVVSMRVYGFDVGAAVADLNDFFGGSGVVGAERAADCMALVVGAQWTAYTRCADSRWRAGARRLLSGQRPFAES